MKFLFTLFLSFTILLNSFSNAIVYLKFKINQDEIAKTICVMRKVKNNSCKGHCALKAELKKQTENEKKHDSNLKEKSEIVYTNLFTEYNFAQYTHLTYSKIANCYLFVKPKSRIIKVFRPPNVSIFDIFLIF